MNFKSRERSNTSSGFSEFLFEIFVILRFSLLFLSRLHSNFSNHLWILIKIRCDWITAIHHRLHPSKTFKRTRAVWLSNECFNANQETCKQALHSHASRICNAGRCLRSPSASSKSYCKAARHVWINFFLLRLPFLLIAAFDLSPGKSSNSLVTTRNSGSKQNSNIRLQL